jgi:hypothetical protein
MRSSILTPFHSDTYLNTSLPQSLSDNIMPSDHNIHMLHNTTSLDPTFNANQSYLFAPPTYLTAFNSSAPPTPDSTQIIPTRASSTRIVSVYRSLNSTGYILQCNTPGCDVTFSRWHEFERHDNAFHGGTSELWCPVPGCSRSKMAGNNPFPKGRKDKMSEHVRRVHGGYVG